VPSRLLIIAEGKINADAVGEVPALEAFAGPLFALARSLRGRDAWPDDVALYVITSKYGLVPADRAIAPARRVMRKEFVAEAMYENYGRLCTALATHLPTEILFAAPETYRRAVFRKDTPQIQRTPVTYVDVSGADAERKILAWLRGNE